MLLVHAPATNFEYKRIRIQTCQNWRLMLCNRCCDIYHIVREVRLCRLQVMGNHGRLHEYALLHKACRSDKSSLSVLFFYIHAHYRISFCVVFFFESLNIFKLLIPVWYILLSSFGFECLTRTKVMLCE